ncbi:OST-HTH/LOTUS domain-containing protein [Cognatiyoonia koreensis]|uniref:OST-HTH/LOTUS domain-containing protein n=1 Tax=Cognatiyoonia koreensis TaxID=364200 RepID=A0A1I0RE65_9RHOB|nr:NYN domain-containing protein [Cognatiyoonia koreensis]SEW39151.1 OST-HTH/LOTUS domain-containing protein [Cognatiyoonia koreensis]
MPREQELLAVLIDADNIPAKYAEAILEEVKRYGEPALRQVYGDWSNDALNGWRKASRELGLVAKQETANTTGKNATDIGLVISAMDILHSGRFDGFVLVSSDSDFTALANRLRENGVKVIGIGEEKTPNSLVKVCNRFVFLENIAAPSTGDKDVEKQGSPKKQPPSKVVPMVLRAMQSLDDEADWYNLSPLGRQINRENPAFDPRTYGSTKLSELLTRTGQFEVRKGSGNGLQVRKKEN